MDMELLGAANGGRGPRGRRMSGGGLDLDDTDTNGEEEKGKPLCARELFAQEGDGKGGSREDLHLIGDLEGGDWEV